MNMIKSQEPINKLTIPCHGGQIAVEDNKQVVWKKLNVLFIELRIL